MVAAGLVKRYDYLVQGRGQTLNVPNITNAFTARSKTQGQDVTDDAVTETQTAISINNWFYNSFIIEDIVSVQSIYDLRTEYSNKAGYSIAKKIDTKQHWCLKTNSNQWGKPEMVTLSKRKRLQRLSELGYESGKRQSEHLLN